MMMSHSLSKTTAFKLKKSYQVFQYKLNKTKTKQKKSLHHMSIVTVRHCKSTDSDIFLWFDTFGKKTDHPLVLIMGLAAQAVAWPEEFCEQLAGRGFYVLRMENRDVGKSVHLDHIGNPSVCGLVCCTSCTKAKYHIQDLAADVIAFVDSQKIDKFSVLGSSLGGFISTHVAHMVGDRLLSLNILYSSPGSPGLPTPTLKISLMLAKGPKDDSVEAAIESSMEFHKYVFSGEEKTKQYDDWIRKRGAMMYNRSTYRGGAVRQYAAIAKQEDRSKICKELKVKTLLIHGDIDPLVPYEHGVALHKLIPNSKLVTIKGMMHGILPCYLDQIVDEVCENAGLMKKNNSSADPDSEDKNNNNDDDDPDSPSRHILAAPNADDEKENNPENEPSA